MSTLLGRLKKLESRKVGEPHHYVVVIKRTLATDDEIDAIYPSDDYNPAEAIRRAEGESVDDLLARAQPSLRATGAVTFAHAGYAVRKLPDLRR